MYGSYVLEELETRVGEDNYYSAQGCDESDYVVLMMGIDTSTQEGDETYFDMAEKHLTISINRLDDISEADLDRVGKKKKY